MPPAPAPSRRLAAILALLAPLPLTACGDDAAGGPVTFATYNAGLAVGFVDHAEARAPLVVDAIAGLEADVVCVQEVWREEDVLALDAAATGFRGHAFLDPLPAEPSDGGDEPACPPAEADPLEACARAACGDLPDDQLAGCVLDACGAEFAATSSTCQGCLSAAIGGSLDDILAACATGAGDDYAYGGAFGVGLLSKGEILDLDTLVFESTINRRALLHARIDLPGGPADVFCTHLSAVFADIPYPREQGSWEEEQAVQIDALRSYVDLRAAGGGPVVLLGDFNTGPAIGDLAGEVAENFAALREGFEAPYLEGGDPACTFCADNPLVGGADDDGSVAIDHVLLRDAGAVTASARILDAPIELAVDGDTIESALSDHYGVAVTVAIEAD